MNIIITIIFSVTCGFIIGFGIAVMLAAAGRESGADALADAQAEIALLRRRIVAQADEIDTVTSILSATRAREAELEELSREMNR